MIDATIDHEAGVLISSGGGLLQPAQRKRCGDGDESDVAELLDRAPHLLDCVEEDEPGADGQAGGASGYTEADFEAQLLDMEAEAAVM